jgi:hypothetical protein
MNENSSEAQPKRINGEQVTGERLSRRLPEAAIVLRRASVVYMRIDYRGTWDVGTMDDPAFYSGNLELMTPSLPTAMRQELRVFFRELLEIRYPGWQNAEGSRGEFEWDFIRDVLTHVHGWRHFEYDYKVLKGL